MPIGRPGPASKNSRLAHFGYGHEGGAGGGAESLDIVPLNVQGAATGATETSDSISFTAGKLYVALVAASGVTVAPTITGDTSSDGWTAIQNRTTATYDFYVLSYVPASTHSETITASWTGAGAHHLMVYRAPGFKTTGTNGSDAFYNNNIEERSTSGLSGSYVINALQNAANYMVCLNLSGTAAWASDNGSMTIVDGIAGWSTSYLWAAYGLNQTNSGTLSWTTSTGLIGLGFEMIPA